MSVHVSMVAVDSMCGGVWCCCGGVVELLVLGDSTCDIRCGEGCVVLLLGCNTFGVSVGSSVSDVSFFVSTCYSCDGGKT